MPFSLGAPIVLLTLALGVHAAGRLVALRSLYKFDTYYYSVAAYKLWQPRATTDDLIPDKPIGQALLTGWCFRVDSGPPSRLVLVPIESAFMIAGYGLFAVLAGRLFGSRIAAALTLFVVIAHQSYNAINNVTDGFNLAENYLLLPMTAAVLAHLTIGSSLTRGFIRGLGLGLALSIKQTALGLAVVLLIHGFVMRSARGASRQGVKALLASCVGMVIAWLPIIGFLQAKGWLGMHLRQLLTLSAQQAERRPTGLPGWERFEPMLPLLWCVLLGIVVAWPRHRTAGGDDDNATNTARQLQLRSAAALALIWLAAEAVIIWILPIPASHHWQQIVVPTALLAGIGLQVLGDRLRSVELRATVREKDGGQDAWPPESGREDGGQHTLSSKGSRTDGGQDARPPGGIGLRGRVAAHRWVFAATLVLAVVAAMPLLDRAWPQVGRLSRRAEIDEFVRWVQIWSPSSAADHLGGGGP